MIANHSSAAVIGRLVAWAEQRISIRAVLLTSTRAVPDAVTDILSDYDVILIVDDIQPFVTDRAWLNDFGEVLVVFWDVVQSDPEYEIDQCGNVTQYTDGLKIDFTLWPVALFQRIAAASSPFAELDAGYRVLLDKDRLTEALPPPTGMAYVPQSPSLETFQTLINDFLTDAPYVAKCLWRDELLPAKWCLDHDMKHVYLRPFLEWRMEIEHDWAAPVGSLGKGLKKYLPPDIWTTVEECYAGAHMADNWAALHRTMALFRRVATEVGASLGYAYPDELHERVVAYVEEIRHLERSGDRSEDS